MATSTAYATQASRLLSAAGGGAPARRLPQTNQSCGMCGFTIYYIDCEKSKAQGRQKWRGRGWLETRVTQVARPQRLSMLLHTKCNCSATSMCLPSKINQKVELKRSTNLRVCASLTQIHCRRWH